MDEQRKKYMREYSRKLREKDPNKYREYHKKYNQTHKEKVNQYVKKYLQKPGIKEKKKKYNTEYYNRPDVAEKRIKKSEENKILKIKYPTKKERDELWKSLPEDRKQLVLERTRKEIFSEVKKGEK